MAERPDYSGQTDIFNPDTFGWDIHLIGCGGIGSTLMYPLAKLGIKGAIHLWDPDVVEPHNIPSQLIYRPSDVGRLKVEAARDFLLRQEVTATIVTHAERVTEATPLSGVVISGVDSMAARQAIWRAIEFDPGIVLYMDGRIGGEQLNLLTLNPSDFDRVEWYKEFELFDDAEAAPLPCAARTCIHPPVVLAGLIIAQLTLLARGMSTTKSTFVHLRTTQLFTN